MPHLNETRGNIAKNRKFLFLQGFLTFISIVNCQYYGPPVPPQYQNEILNPPDVSLFPQVNERNPSDSYHFSYVAPDQTGGYHTRHEMRDPSGRVTGSYTINDNGILRRVDYIADEYGYRAVVRTNEPGTTSHQPSGVNFQSVHDPTVGNFQQRMKRDVSIPTSPRLARKSGYLPSYINYKSGIENLEKRFPHQQKITSGKDMPAPFFIPVENSKIGDFTPVLSESYPYPPTKSPPYPPYPPTKSHPPYPPYPPTKSHPPYPPYPPTKSHPPYPPYPPTYPPSPPPMPPSPPTQPPSPPTLPPSPPTHPPTPPTLPPSPPTHPPTPPTLPPSPPTHPPTPPTQPPSPPTQPPSPPTLPPSPPTQPPSPPTLPPSPPTYPPSPPPPSPPTYPPSPPTLPPSPPTYPPSPPTLPPSPPTYPPSPPPPPPPAPPKSCCYPPYPPLPPIQISKSIYLPQPIYPPLPPKDTPKSISLPPSTNNQNYPSFYPGESQSKFDYPNMWNYGASPYWNKMSNHDAYQGKSQMYNGQGNILPDLIFPNHQHLNFPYRRKK